MNTANPAEENVFNNPVYAEDISLKIIENLEELEDIRNFWEKIVEQPDADLDYFMYYLTKSDGIISRPYVILIYQCGSPSSLIIGRIHKKPLLLKLGYKTLYKSRAICLEIINGEILGNISSSQIPSVITQFRNCLKQGKADYIVVPSLRVDSLINKDLQKKISFVNRDLFVSVKSHWRLTLPVSFEEFYQQRSKNTKSNIRKYRNRMNKAFSGNYSIKCFQKESEIDQAINDVEVVTSKTWMRGMGIGFTKTSETFDKWVYFAKRHWLRVYILYIEEKPVAYWNGLLYNKIFHIWIPGYDPAYKYYHPGMFLLMKMLDDFCSSDEVEFVDFGLIDMQYKREYCDLKWEEVRRYIFASKLKGFRLWLMHNFSTGASELLKFLLIRFKILDKVKKGWRDYISKSKITNRFIHAHKVS